MGDDEFRTLTTPQVIDGQRVSGLRFGDTTVLAVLTALMMFRDLPQGFTNSQLRHTTARLLTCSAQDLKPGLLTYHLRRLRRRGLITRIPRTHRYEVTDDGHRAALFDTTSLARVIRPTATDLDNPKLLAKLAKALAPTKT